MEQEEPSSNEDPRKAITLSETTKEVIKNNVAKLKEVLNEDQESLIKVISYIVNDFALGRDVGGVIMNHYSTVVEQCRKEHKARPSEIAQVRNAAATLYHLTTGEGKEMIPELEKLEPYTEEKWKQLKILCQEEIGKEFNPDVSYRSKVDSEVIWNEFIQAMDEYPSTIGSDDENW